MSGASALLIDLDADVPLQLSMQAAAQEVRDLDEQNAALQAEALRLQQLKGQVRGHVLQRRLLCPLLKLTRSVSSGCTTSWHMPVLCICNRHRHRHQQWE